MATATLESGRWVTPSLRLTERIDEGAMGSVWLADHTRLDTEVVVKFVRQSLASNETVRRRMEIEARAAARIRSPHVVRVFDFGVYEETRPYIVMERLVGASLRDRLDLDDTLSLRDTMVMVNHTCRALQEAHRLGIVHRDIKPANLFLLDDEVQGLFVKVLDFGVAKGIAQQITEPGGLVGTPAYLSPEQLKDQSASHMSDLWALAAVTYECLVGDGPFHAETVDEVFARIWRCQADPPSLANHQISPELDAWFERALGRHAELRPQSASEFASSFFDAALTCEEMLNAPDEEWSSTRWRLELDGPRNTQLLGSTPGLPRARERRVSAVELTAAADVVRTLGGGDHAADPRSTSHWSERPPESRPPPDSLSTRPAPASIEPPTPEEDDGAPSNASRAPEAAPAEGEERELLTTSTANDDASRVAAAPTSPRRTGPTVGLGLGLGLVVGVGLYFATGAPEPQPAPTPPAVVSPTTEPRMTDPARTDARSATDPDAPASPEGSDATETTEAPPRATASTAPTSPPPSSAGDKPSPPVAAPPTEAKPEPARPEPAPPPHPSKVPAPTQHGKQLGF